MELEWDHDKSERCYHERGFDFAYAARVFLDPRREIICDDRFAYGELRYQVYGTIESRLFVVVYTERSETIRIISARKANKREVKRYGKPQH